MYYEELPEKVDTDLAGGESERVNFLHNTTRGASEISGQTLLGFREQVLLLLREIELNY